MKNRRAMRAISAIRKSIRPNEQAKAGRRTVNSPFMGWNGRTYTHTHTQVITFEYNRENANEHLMMNDELRTESFCV